MNALQPPRAWNISDPFGPLAWEIFLSHHKCTNPVVPDQLMLNNRKLTLAISKLCVDATDRQKWLGRVYISIPAINQRDRVENALKLTAKGAVQTCFPFALEYNPQTDRVSSGSVGFFLNESIVNSNKSEHPFIIEVLMHPVGDESLSVNISSPEIFFYTKERKAKRVRALAASWQPQQASAAPADTNDTTTDQQERVDEEYDQEGVFRGSKIPRLEILGLESAADTVDKLPSDNEQQDGNMDNDEFNDLFTIPTFSYSC